MWWTEQHWIVKLTFKTVFSILGRDAVEHLEGKNKTNPLTPMSDQDRISPNNINTE